MRRALEIASLGGAAVAPNPQVGCVIVKEGKIVSEGWTQRYGEAHAERDAVNKAPDVRQLIGSTVYVTLEPCAHFGKTPPCCDLLIEHQVARVVICNVDPNPLVNGQGLARMQAAGITVETGLLAELGQQINADFFQQFV